MVTYFEFTVLNPTTGTLYRALVALPIPHHLLQTIISRTKEAVSYIRKTISKLLVIPKL